MVFDGTTATTAESTASQNATDIISFSITSKTGGAITASVGIFFGSAITYILFNQTINSGTAYVWPGDKIRVPPDYKIFVSVSGSADFYFTVL